MPQSTTSDDAASTPPPSNGRTASRTASKRKKKEKVKPTFKENVQFWVKAILIIIFLRAFIFEPYRIPSESMEDTLLVRDFLIVSKLHYGPRTPNTIGVPFTRIYLPGLEFPQTRLPGFSPPERGDVVVFNYPARRDVERGPIAADVPIERRAPYIKRIVGVPGDTLAVVDKVLTLNLQSVPLGETLKQRWVVFSETRDRPTEGQLDEMGIFYQRGSDEVTAAGVRAFTVDATPDGARSLEALPGIDRVDPWVLPDSVTFRDFTGPDQLDLIFNPALGWNPDQYGPLQIPGMGTTIEVNEATMEVYREVIEQYEGVEVAAQRGGGFLFNGVPRDAYTFQQDYFFVMGDNRDNSVDSRWWGLVPESHLVGKAVFTFLSFERWIPPIPRFDRFFRPVP
ncbi:MAG: signal peptidase I [Bacteroidota bacterium]